MPTLKDLYIKAIIMIVGTAILLPIQSCHQQDHTTINRGIYHWKTTFNHTAWELQFMEDHKIDRLYIKMFDVDVNPDTISPYHVVPVATTRFLQPAPSSMMVVPTVYVANSALAAADDCAALADSIYQYLNEMANINEVRNYEEVQLDCDYATSKRAEFTSLCRRLRQRLNKRHIQLSTTVRLHQLNANIDKQIPADRLVLMLYNTGNISNPMTRNSILDTVDALPYLRRMAHLPSNLDLALPAFAWGVAFSRDAIDAPRQTWHYTGLIASPEVADTTQYSPTRTAGIYAMRYTPAQMLMRYEQADPSQIARTVRQLPPATGEHTTLLYHLDSANLAKYTYDEIEAFYSR